MREQVRAVAVPTAVAVAGGFVLGWMLGAVVSVDASFPLAAMTAGTALYIGLRARGRDAKPAAAAGATAALVAFALAWIAFYAFLLWIGSALEDFD